MSDTPLALELNGTELIPVPSVHYSTPFACEVHILCRDMKTRPDAVVVELGPHTAAELNEWLGSLPEERLPLMLAYVKRNRMLRPSFKDRCVRLQKETCAPLSELDSDLLKEELNYYSREVLYLTPTDSIIEAARSAAELGIDFYGVDLEEMALPIYKEQIFPDPLNGGTGIHNYIKKNMSIDNNNFDRYIDPRREIVMAARLKTIMKTHKRVLFVCGMGHWLSIQQLLTNPEIKPGKLACAAPPFKSMRVLAHPSLATQYIDRFPAVAMMYEKWRREASVKQTALKPLEHKRIRLDFDRIIKNVCKKYFHGENHCSKKRISNDLVVYPKWRTFLRNMDLLNLREISDMGLTLRAAKTMMSDNFLITLRNSFMNIPWADPKDYPDYPVLSQSSNHSDNLFMEDLGTFTAVPAFTGAANTPLRVEEHTQKQNIKSSNPLSFSKRHTWTAWDYLISGLSLSAIRDASVRASKKRSEPFSGSLLDGFDMKRTIREYTRGKESVFVKENANDAFTYAIRTNDGFPVVWLLDDEPDELQQSWIPLYESMHWIQRHSFSPKHCMEVIKKQGDKMVALIGYGNRNIECPDNRISGNKFAGLILFQPICWNNIQFARWGETTAYRRNPIAENIFLDSKYSSELKSIFQSTLGLELPTENIDWKTSLILMAIPFSRGVVTLVAPRSCRISPMVNKIAKQMNVHIARTDLDNYPPARRRRLSLNYMAPSICSDPETIFEPWVGEALGESPTDNRELVPAHWRDFGINSDR